nr:MAG TPA: hypothetical protein [Bacteriophage sp.]
MQNLVDFGIPLMYHIGVNDNQLRGILFSTHVSIIAQL